MGKSGSCVKVKISDDAACNSVLHCGCKLSRRYEVDELKLELPKRGSVAAKSTSRMSPKVGFTWTKVTGGTRCCPEFVEEQKRVNDKDDCFTVLAEWGARKFFDVHGTALAFTG